MASFRHFFLAVILFVSIAIDGCHTQPLERKSVAIAFYNCENFFDTIHNPLKNNFEFTPSGKNHYTRARYERKLHNIALVLQSIAGNSTESLPAIIGLAEIENETVLTDLISQPELSGFHYRYRIFNGPDERGINVALLYDSTFFKFLHAEPISINLSSFKGKQNTRDILHVFGVLGKDSVHVFVNHWPSRRAATDETGEKRRYVSNILRNIADSITTVHPTHGIIVMGDFNDNPTDSSIAALTRASKDHTPFFNPFEKIYNQGKGTEKFDNKWNLFDQILLSPKFITQPQPGSWRFDSACIFNPSFITCQSSDHQGEPQQFYLGSRCLYGFSDHFPVIVYLKR